MYTRIAVLLLLPLPLFAQLELPEYLFPEEVPDEQIKRTVPGHEGGEKKAEEPKVKESKESEAQRDQMMQMMNNPAPMNFQGRGNLGGRPGNLPDDSRQVKRLTGGAAELLAQVTLSKGQPFQGNVANQVILIEAAFGKLPLRLGEVQRLLRQEDGSFLFEIRGGDLLQGKPLSEKLTLHLLDGGKRVVSLRELSSIELTPVISETPVP